MHAENVKANGSSCKQMLSMLQLANHMRYDKKTTIPVLALNSRKDANAVDHHHNLSTRDRPGLLAPQAPGARTVILPLFWPCPCLLPRGQRREIGEHTSELQSPDHLVCRLLLEKKKKKTRKSHN